ncbi:MAG: tRNA lysidine(34) synthetase TilS [Bacteroidales bacterium]|jgi:tRNA(Ile)-lysidine synthase|nr:tRNA lysidine(34) synthetase TilS [Bacteroidales bacterium]
MLQRFLDHSKQEKLFSTSSRILLAVSGGIDSMVMASLFDAACTEHEIAHCNFSLRGRESDDDERFVVSYGAKRGIKVHTMRFDTLGYAASGKISVQMAARELRYEWFDTLVSQGGFDAVAVAHNLDDNIETFMINLLRGTGISGLTGMSTRHNNIIRPLLFATRDEIAAWAAEKKVDFREDSSNAGLKYARNMIRHLIIPEMERVRPGARNAITATMSHLKSSSEIVDLYIEKVRQEIFRCSEEGCEADIASLTVLKPAEPHIYELFRKFNISSGQTGELLSLLGSPTGRFMDTSTHRLLVDRGKLRITEKSVGPPPDQLFHSIDDMHISGLFTDLRVILPSDEPFPPGRLTACVDLGLITFPVKVRQWEPGDRFRPLGMTRMKKISDFLIDLKVPATAKEKVLLLLSGDEVVWVMGYRIDDRYRVTDKTERILTMTI